MSSRRSPGFIDGPEDFEDLEDYDRNERTSALSAINLARRLDLTVEDAAADLGVGMDTVRWWASEALDPTIRGETLPTPADDLFRVRPVALEGEVGFRGVPGSRQAEVADRIFAVQWEYIHGRADISDLQALPTTFGGQAVVRDPRELDRLARQGLFDIEELYRDLFGT